MRLAAVLLILMAVFDEQRDARLLAEAARKLQAERDACRSRHPARRWTLPGEEL